MAVDFILDQCEVALRILESDPKCGGETLLTELFSTKGYRWLKERELAMKQEFTDADFSTFILSDDLRQQAQLFRAVLDNLQKLSMESLANQAKEYLPSDANIDAFVVPLIKPKRNSFVYPIEGKIVVFLSLNSDVTTSRLQNTIAHELHHVGLRTVYQGPNSVLDGVEDSRIKELLRFTQPLGEGYAMLAAAGGPDIHPNDHDPELKILWDQRMTTFDRDFDDIDQFLCDVFTEKYDQEEAMEKGFEMMGVQGPWYTVGWKTAAVIELAYGKNRLIQCIADPTQLFSTYNQATSIYKKNHGTSLPTWSLELVEAFNEEHRS